MNTEELRLKNEKKFIDRCKSMYGDKFDYSKVHYVSYKTKVLIHCNVHNEDFWQTPDMHFNFPGCKQCAAEHKSKARRMSNEEFIKRAKEVHGDKYDYSKTVYTGNNEYVTVICPKHGEFKVNAYRHLTGSMCPECTKFELKKKCSEIDIVSKFKAVHGDKYDYSKVKYVNAKTKVCIICPKHGEFWQTPNKHLAGQGCPLCGYESAALKGRNTLDDFIKKAKSIHGDKYDYSQVVYTKNSDKITIICQEHGEFIQEAASHLSGSGCPKCAQLARNQKSMIGKEQFIKRSIDIHGNKYDYCKVEYINNSTPVTIICPEHGEFQQMPCKHLNGHGCPQCGGSAHLTTEQFIERASAVHNNKYDYSEVEYTNNREKVKIYCPKHGYFMQEANAHLAGAGCPKCSVKESKNETELGDYIEHILHVRVERRNRIILKGKEIDLYIPDKHIGIEYNGLLWHSDKYKKLSTFHLDKTISCQQKGIKLIQIFEDEYINHKDIVLSKIRHLLNVDATEKKIMARKCIISSINKVQAKVFLESNHIQGFVRGSVYLGCFYEGELVAVMSFNKEKQEGLWELNRFAGKIGYQLQGVGGKLFRYFINEYKPLRVKSFADRRWTVNEDNNLYIKLGFEFDGYVPPDYKYIHPSKMERKHKFNFRKQILAKKYNFPLSMTEFAMTESLGYHRIYDCGLIRYVWHNLNK